jgi:HTH-type transcriptional regulator / antitoxin HipB
MWAQSAAEIGRIVSTARRHRGLTQVQLAREVGATQYWISQIECGKETAQIGRVLRVLSFLGVRLKTGHAPWMSDGNSAKRTQSLLECILAKHTEGPRKKRAR